MSEESLGDGCREDDRCESEGDENRWELDDAKSANPGIEAHDSREPTQGVPVSPSGKEVACVGCLDQREGGVEANGKTTPVRDVSMSSGDATLRSFLQQKEKRCVGKRIEEQLGLGVAECSWDSTLLSFMQQVGSQEVILNLAEAAAEEEVPRSRLDSEEVASKRRLSQKLSMARDLAGRPRKSYKVVKRNYSKEKEAFKLQRMKKRAEINRLKKSYLVELEGSNKSFQLAEEECHLEVEKEGEGEDRRRLDREEAERTYHIATRLGIKGNLPEEEMIQFYGSLLN
ncbi:hypothetical protein QQ045_006360 [Rhodiola kirilowii]